MGMYEVWSQCKPKLVIVDIWEICFRCILLIYNVDVPPVSFFQLSSVPSLTMSQLVCVILITSLANQDSVSLLFINLSTFLFNQIIATDILFTINSKFIVYFLTECFLKTGRKIGNGCVTCQHADKKTPSLFKTDSEVHF